VANEIDVEAVLERCRELIEQIDAALSVEESLLSLDVSATAELLSHLESAFLLSQGLRDASWKRCEAGPQR
jgi:hypothetical protein